MRFENNGEDVIILGSMIGTILSPLDQKDLIKWFMNNKPELVKECRNDIRTMKALKQSMKAGRDAP